MKPHPRLFAGYFPCAIVYADRARERHGDYLQLATLPYRTLVLEWCEPKERVPAELRRLIELDAAEMAAKRGELYPVTTAGQTVRLGGALPSD